MEGPARKGGRKIFRKSRHGLDSPIRSNSVQVFGLLLFQDRRQIPRIARHIGRPGAEAAVIIHGLNQFREKLPFRLLLLVVLSFDFQNQHLAAGQPHQLVGPELADDPLV